MVYYYSLDGKSKLLSYWTRLESNKNSISFKDTNLFGETKGARFNVDAKIMAIWSLAPAHDKPTLMEIKEIAQGNAIFWNVHMTSSD